MKKLIAILACITLVACGANPTRSGRNLNSICTFEPNCNAIVITD